MTDIQLLTLLQTFDGLFPIGSFTMSGGLESAVQSGAVASADDTLRWCRDSLAVLPYGELGCASLGFRLAGDEAALLELDALAFASKAPSELRSASVSLCRRFMRLRLSIAPSPALEHYQGLVAAGAARGCYGLAVGLFLRDSGIPMGDGLTAFCGSLISAAVTNAVKLIPLSHTEGQRLLAGLHGDMAKAVAVASEVQPDELGLSGAGFDLFSMEHEIMYSRMYIS